MINKDNKIFSLVFTFIDTVYWIVVIAIGTFIGNSYSYAIFQQMD